MAQRLQDRGRGAGDPRCRRRHAQGYRACQVDERHCRGARRRLRWPCGSQPPSPIRAWDRRGGLPRAMANVPPRETAMVSDFSAGFEPADRLAEDRESVRKRFWIKLKQVAAKLPFTEDLLAAYYCAFDKQTPRHVQAALLGAIAYFILPFDFIPDMLPVLGYTDDAAVLATAIRLVAIHITEDHREAARAALKRGIREG